MTRWMACAGVLLFGCGAAPVVTVSADKTHAAADGSDAITVTAVVTGGGSVTFSSDAGHLGATTQTSSGATVTVTSSEAATVTVTASVEGAQSAHVTLTFDAAQSTGKVLRFATSPANTQAQNLLRPVPVVNVEDASGALQTGSSATVTVSVTPGSCGGTALDPNSLYEVDASNGVASFYGLKIATPATGCTLTASSPGLTSAVSASFDVL